MKNKEIFETINYLEAVIGSADKASMVELIRSLQAVAARDQIQLLLSDESLHTRIRELKPKETEELDEEELNESLRDYLYRMLGRIQTTVYRRFNDFNLFQASKGLTDLFKDYTVKEKKNIWKEGHIEEVYRKEFDDKGCLVEEGLPLFVREIKLFRRVTTKSDEPMILDYCVAYRIEWDYEDDRIAAVRGILGERYRNPNVLFATDIDATYRESSPASKGAVRKRYNALLAKSIEWYKSEHPDNSDNNIGGVLLVCAFNRNVDLRKGRGRVKPSEIDETFILSELCHLDADFVNDFHIAGIYRVITGLAWADRRISVPMGTGPKKV